jgi:hypothetical protein
MKTSYEDMHPGYDQFRAEPWNDMPRAKPLKNEISRRLCQMWILFSRDDRHKKGTTCTRGFQPFLFGLNAVYYLRKV